MKDRITEITEEVKKTIQKQQELDQLTKEITQLRQNVTNEMTHYDNRHRQRTSWGTGMNPTGLYTNMFEERTEKDLSKKQPRSL